MKNMKEILEKISAEHPYKVSGDWDSYSQYNEAWQDCIARIEQEMDLMQQENRFEFNFSGVKAFDCQCGRRYVNTDGWIPVEERLPEDDGFYIATMDGEIVGQEEPFVGLAELENGLWVDDDIDYRCIIAWQSLPEPYSPERRSDEKE